MESLHNLTRLSVLKSWLGVSGGDDDVLLERLISQTSRAILGYLDRPSIHPGLYTEFFDGGYDTSILLRQWPVISVLSCTVSGVSAPASIGGFSATITDFVVDAADVSPPGRMQRLSLRGGVFLYGVQNVSISYRAGYQISSESIVVPSYAPFVVNVEAPYGDFASDVGVTDVSGSPRVKVSSNPGAGQYTCDDGAYSFSAIDAGASMLISYGYVPSELARCCIEWAADQYQYRSRIGQHTKSLGGQESVSFIVKDMPDLVRTVLQPYRRIISP